MQKVTSGSLQTEICGFSNNRPYSHCDNLKSRIIRDLFKVEKIIFKHPYWLAKFLPINVNCMKFWWLKIMRSLWKVELRNFKSWTTPHPFIFTYLSRKNGQSQYINTKMSENSFVESLPHSFLMNIDSMAFLLYLSFKTISFHGHILLRACYSKTMTLPLLRPTLSKWRSMSVSSRHSLIVEDWHIWNERSAIKILLSPGAERTQCG